MIHHRIKELFFSIFFFENRTLRLGEKWQMKQNPENKIKCVEYRNHECQSVPIVFVFSWVFFPAPFPLPCICSQIYSEFIVFTSHTINLLRTCIGDCELLVFLSILM